MFEILTKKKIVISLIVVLIITIVVIYYESKIGLVDKFLSIQNLAEEQENVSKDNFNNINATKCWEKEDFKIKEMCNKCDKFLRKTLLACKASGYREVIKCDKYGMVSRSCEIPIEIQKKHFWLFEFFVTIFLIVSTSVVIKRKQFLDKKATERVRKQLINEN